MVYLEEFQRVQFLNILSTMAMCPRMTQSVTMYHLLSSKSEPSQLGP